MGLETWVLGAFLVGSTASRNPSANRLKLIINMARTVTGAITRYGYDRNEPYPSLTREPRDAMGALTPRPI